MKAVLISPGERPEVPFLALNGALAAVPALGFSIVEYWMSHLACCGIKQVVISASKSPDEIGAIVGNGSRWGMAVEVCAETRELTAEQALEKYAAPASVMDCFPGLPERLLFQSYAHWFNALGAWMPHAKTPDRVGVNEVSPGVWVGRHAHIARDAILRGPCWLGDHVFVGPRAVVGPHAILENRAFLEPDAQVERSIIGPDTFVGRYVQIRDSLAWGSALVDLLQGQQTTVADAFVLCSLHRPPPRLRTPRLMDRLAEILKRWKDDEALASSAVIIK